MLLQIFFISCVLWISLFKISDGLEEDVVTRVKRLQQKVGGLQQTVLDHAIEIEKVKNQNNFVGFTAYSNDQSLSQGDRVVFDVVQSNIGEGYDTVTGIFTCPFSGLYYFGVASYSTTSYMILQLVKEDVELTGAFADSANYNQGANFWVTQCNANERVWCRSGRDVSGTLSRGIDGTILNSFVGFLVGLST